ncbi:MAG: A/G-specific adenine glycosylase [Treponema sp.]|nr:A/G-specific adenine glycosylase [Treponema sp.]
MKDSVFRDTAEFRRIIYSHYEEAGRVFPWRKNTDPWGVLVSEFMLQQTQTDRVIPYWERWMRLWPSPRDLACASLETVMREWSGLGYNRRARYIRDCAAAIIKDHKCQVPETPEELQTLPGIGPYTAGAIACFGYNYPAVFIETNIRAAALHFFFQDREGVKDREVFPFLEAALDRETPRKWYWALMDYGAALKKLAVNPNRKSAHYARQSPFEGSFRRLRGMVIKALAFQGPATAEDLARRTGIGQEDVYKAAESLEKDLMVAEKEGVYRIADMGDIE